MKCAIMLVFVAFLMNPAFAQNTSQAPPNAPKASGGLRPEVTYEDCETRCKQCGTGRNPDCVRNFCTGYPRRKPGAAPLPVVCPQYGN